MAETDSSNAAPAVIGLGYAGPHNTRVIDIVHELRDDGVPVGVHDPWTDATEARAEYGFALTMGSREGVYDGAVLAAVHARIAEAAAGLCVDTVVSRTCSSTSRGGVWRGRKRSETVSGIRCFHHMAMHRFADGIAYEMLGQPGRQ